MTQYLLNKATSPPLSSNFGRERKKRKRKRKFQPILLQ